MKARSVIVGLAGLVMIGTTVGIWLKPAEHHHVSELTFNIIDSPALNLTTLRGRPVLITFWATTCRSCVEEIPQLVELYRELAPRGLEIIAVAMPYDPPNQVMAMRQTAKIPYPIALDLDGSGVRAFGNVSLTPTTFVVDPQGKIVAHKIGKLDMSTLRTTLEPLLQNSKG